MPTIPDRSSWPQPERQTSSAGAFTELIVATFRLNGLLMEAAQELAAQGGLTSAWWQVLGGVLDEPRSVAEIGRRMGMTRQAVQRVADLLVEQGLAAYQDNPQHKRAKLLVCTEAGYWAVRQISVAQHPWANRIADQLSAGDLAAACAVLDQLSERIETDRASASS